VTLRAVGHEERYNSIRQHIKVAAEIVATFEAAFEDNIDIDRDRSLVMLREALLELQLAAADAMPEEFEIDGHPDLT
jgi:hypothetical protein